ncbi:caspase family protein [Rubinisphaera brasiliensis]|nr:caspase family protein [Rubinisphaera brasiliensis]
MTIPDPALKVDRMRTTACLIVLLTLASVAIAQEPSKARGNRGLTAISEEVESNVGTRWALLVGINRYRNLPELQFCVQDMEALRDALVDHGGYLSSRVRLLTEKNNRDFPVTREDILIELENLLGQVQPNDSILFAFTGHGDVDSLHRAWLLPAPAALEDDEHLRQTAISVAEIYAKMQHVRVRQRFIVLDACHSGGARSADPASRFGNAELPAIAEGEGTIELLSCDTDQLSHEHPELRHGVFSHFLIGGLSGEADTEGNQDGIVTVDELYA